MRVQFKGTAYLPEYRGLHDGQLVHACAGETIEVSKTEGAKLLRDFPGVFVPDPQAPPHDRQIKEPTRRRRVGAPETK